MRRAWIGVALLGAVMALAACGSEGPLLSADEAYERAETAYDAATTTEAKVAIAKDYLVKYPSSEHAVDAAEALAADLGDELGDPAQAAELIGAAAAKAEDPEVAFDLGVLAAKQAIEAGLEPDVEALATALASARPLSYSDHLDIVELALEAEAWELVLEHGDDALAVATPEAFRADYPDEEFDDGYVERAANRRRTMVLPYVAWAQFRTGRVDEAEATFAEADQITGRSFVGVPPTDLDLYRGRMALERGEHERALEILAAEAVMGGTEAAMEPFRRAYLALGRDEADFDEHLWQARNELAKPAVDFTLPTYDGGSVSLSDFNGQVVMLAFWFPT